MQIRQELIILDKFEVIYEKHNMLKHMSFLEKIPLNPLPPEIMPSGDLSKFLKVLPTPSSISFSLQFHSL